MILAPESHSMSCRQDAHSAPLVAPSTARTPTACHQSIRAKSSTARSGAARSVQLGGCSNDPGRLPGRRNIHSHASGILRVEPWCRLREEFRRACSPSSRRTAQQVAQPRDAVPIVQGTSEPECLLVPASRRGSSSATGPFQTAKHLPREVAKFLVGRNTSRAANRASATDPGRGIGM
jgi:hypothetical protein